MPRYPQIQPYLSSISGRPFSKFADEIAKMGTATYPLHIGDTYLLPFAPARIENIQAEKYHDSHKYVAPKGLPALIEVLSDAYNTSSSSILVTPGATGGLHTAAMSVLSSGDEVLILAPYWPLAAGIIRAVGATPVCVPFYDKEGTVFERIQPYITSKTVAIYVNSPNNPTGLLMKPQEVMDLAHFARVHNLWIFSDEVYERLIYSGTQLPIRVEAPERTISIFSFSKAYALAGYRCGFLIVPNPEIFSAIHKAVVHSFYSVATPAQYASMIALTSGEQWLYETRNAYEQIGVQCAKIFSVPSPVAGTFLFLDTTSYLNGRTMDDILLSCIQHKLLLAPGGAFGAGYENYIRLCFTSAPPDIVLEGMAILYQILTEDI